MRTKNNILIFLVIVSIFILWLITIADNWPVLASMSLFFLLALIIPLICHLITKSLRVKSRTKGILFSLIITPLIIIFGDYIGCIGNPEAMMWFLIGSFFMILFTSPVWIFSSFFTGKLATKIMNK